MTLLDIDVGIPPWEELSKQPNIRFGCWGLVESTSVPWIVKALSSLSQGFPDDYLMDVRFWPRLEVGCIPGAPIGWHADITRPGGRHRLFSIGAGSRTEFEGFGQLESEGRVVEYGKDIHRAREATFTGPRLLLRVTQPTSSYNKNIVGLPTVQYRKDR